MKKIIFGGFLIAVLIFGLIGCDWNRQEAQPRLSLFIGMDISGSFMNSGYFDDGVDFLAHYIYAHLHGLGGLEKPNVLFVGSIGGAKQDEPKTFYPIQTFENKSVQEINDKLREIFPKDEMNPFTDFNAFFEQISETVKNKNLLMRPVSVVMITDGLPDVKKEGETDFRNVILKPMEQLARNVTIRILYTNAELGNNWQTRVKRQRVRVWTQDAEVMVSWKDPGILLQDIPIEHQGRFFNWIKDNVDFEARSRRVD
jgi:hypothetical protein